MAIIVENTEGEKILVTVHQEENGQPDYVTHGTELLRWDPYEKKYRKV